MNIRQATGNDSLLLSRLCMDVQRLHAEKHPDIFKMPQREDFAVTYFDEMLADPAVAIYLAEEDGETTGYILCKLFERPETVFTHANRFLSIEHISVRPAARQRGVGSALMARAERLAKDLHVTRIQLNSWDFNTTAHSLFEKCGFRKTEHRFRRDL